MYKYTCSRDVNVTHGGYSAWHLITRAKEHISNQRWSPRGHILKSLALASRPQVLENWPVLGSRTALFFELLKFCGALFFWRALALVSLVLGLGFEHSCPWPRECLSLEWLSLALASGQPFQGQTLSRPRTLFILHKQCTYCIIVSTLQFAALMLELTTLTGNSFWC